jgi:hypothetical protein
MPVTHPLSELRTLPRDMVRPVNPPFDPAGSAISTAPNDQSSPAAAVQGTNSLLVGEDR